MSAKQEGQKMLFRQMYFHLFSALTDALRFLQAGDTEAAVQRLTAAQQEAEEMYISAEGDE